MGARPGGISHPCVGGAKTNRHVPAQGGVMKSADPEMVCVALFASQFVP